MSKIGQVTGGAILGLAIFVLMAWMCFTLPGIVFVAAVIILCTILWGIRRK